MQSLLNKSVQNMLKLTQDLPEWQHTARLRDSQIKEIEKQAADEGEDPKAAVAAKMPKPLSKLIAEHKDVNKLVIALNTSMSSFKAEVVAIIKNFTGFSELWEKEPEPTVKEFMAAKPLMVDLEAKFRHYKQLQVEIEEFANSYQVGSIIYRTDALKRSLITEIGNWKLAFGKAMNEKAGLDMKNLMEMVDEIHKKLSRPCKDLDDIRSHMDALNSIKEKEIAIDRTITPIEETYTMLNKYEITFNDGNAEKVDTMVYGWKNLNEKAREVQDHLIQVQPSFKSDLTAKVVQFKKDVDIFSNDYTKKGPMVEGIPPREASDRLSIYQARFDECWRKFETYSGGEDLFGIPQTNYADLQRIKKELNLLQKLYGLYNAVIDTINGYYDIPWVDVNIEKINADLVDFGNKCRKLPKGLKEYQAFNDLKKVSHLNHYL
jgi:dynein heavy chain